MPINTAQLLAGANYTLQTFTKDDPVDQFTTERPFAAWLIANKVESTFGNGIYNERIRLTNDSNYQNFERDDQVTYNRRDSVRHAQFQHYEAHDGFSLNETDLADNGITMTDDKNAVMSGAEEIQLVNKLTEGYAILKDGFQEKWDTEMHLDGSQSAKACPGLDALVSVDGTGVIGGIDASTATYWANNFATGIASTSGLLNETMEKQWRACTTKGKLGSPNKIIVGSKFLDAYCKDVRAQPGTTMMVTQPAKGGATLDGSRTGVFFKGIELEWDPTFDALQALLNPTINWDKRCYFLNNKAIKLRPNRGRWMQNRKPSRIYDRYTHFFGLTSDYGLTVKQRNAMSVLSIA